MQPKRIHRRNFNLPYHAHELTFSCYKRFPFLRSERTCRWLLESIEVARTELGFCVWAYVIMPEHVHLLLWSREPQYDIAKIRRAIKEPVGRAAMAFLEERAPHWLTHVSRTRGRRTERLFWQSGGGYDRNIESTGVLLAAIEYIHLNPVRRGFVERPEMWQWSSAAFYGCGTSPLVPDQIPADWVD
jgi:putative transposase